MAPAGLATASEGLAALKRKLAKLLMNTFNYCYPSYLFYVLDTVRRTG
jgi:hypothetical protein